MQTEWDAKIEKPEEAKGKKCRSLSKKRRQKYPFCHAQSKGGRRKRWFFYNQFVC